MLRYVQVIYGDTDSIMIHTNSIDYDAAEALGAKVKAAVNRWEWLSHVQGARERRGGS